MNYAGIKDNDIANGEGVRVSLFVSGCTHHCLNCFNPETWNFDYGEQFTIDVQNKILKMIEPDYVRGLTLLGGEPLHPQNQKAVLELIKAFREKYGNTKSIWCYTGYIFPNDFDENGRAKTEFIQEILDNVDILVDGPFVDKLKDIRLKFRGSSNQRIIDLKQTKQTKQIVLYIQ